MLDLTGAIIDFENGELGQKETIELFSKLVKDGLAWTLQGSYGRAAHGLIELGILDSEGSINWDRVTELEDY